MGGCCYYFLVQKGGFAVHELLEKESLDKEFGWEDEQFIES